MIDFYKAQSWTHAFKLFSHPWCGGGEVQERVSCSAPRRCLPSKGGASRVTSCGALARGLGPAAVARTRGWRADAQQVLALLPPRHEDLLSHPSTNFAQSNYEPSQKTSNQLPDRVCGILRHDVSYLYEIWEGI